ncbi:MAG: RNA polymerase III-inhibiting protein maf1 [Geoglossum umbratile]|nr:MAG: RNA polymerase III-inhibiting protein maf1 [Geoglossum umbratile]
MKFLSLRDFEDVTSALNFDTPDCHVIGGCDLFTTKAAGSDKKLYKSIDKSLESQYQSLLRLSASLSPPQASSAASSLNLSRSSPFGPLTQISSRRTFAYLIATLNASHPDYDFSHILRPTDFRRERSLKSVMNTLNTTLYNLRPRPTNPSLAVPNGWSNSTTPAGSSAAAGAQVWGPRMWALIDKEMDLKDCSIYCYAPEEDPYDGEEGAIWRFDYFFFNKARKRVCYLYLRGLSILSHSPMHSASRVRGTGTGKRRQGSMSGASKRATYWLGERAAGEEVEGGREDDDGEDDIIEHYGDDEVDVEGEVLDDGDEIGGYGVEEDVDGDKCMRGVSAEIAESIEV